jgi:acetyl-CoA acetyltransferase
VRSQVIFDCARTNDSADDFRSKTVVETNILAYLFGLLQNGDAGVSWSSIIAITVLAKFGRFISYVFSASICGQAALYQLSLTGIPIINVNNNCMVGSTVLFDAVLLICSGEACWALALGFELMHAVACTLPDAYTESMHMPRYYFVLGKD